MLLVLTLFLCCMHMPCRACRLRLSLAVHSYETRTVDRVVQTSVNGVLRTTHIHVTAPFSAAHTAVMAYVNATGTTGNEVRLWLLTVGRTQVVGC